MFESDLDIAPPTSLLLPDHTVRAERLAGVGRWNWNLTDGRFWLTAGARTIFGLPDQFAPTWDAFLHAIDQIDRDRLEEEVADSLTFMRVFELVVRRQDANGATHYILIKGQPHLEKNGGAIFEGVCQDITETYLAHRQLENEKQNALEASLDKTRRIAAVCHDLRQPLQALGLFVHLLSGHVHSQEGQAILGNANLAVDSLNNLMKGLLDISHLDAGQIAPKQERLIVSTVLDRLSKEFSRPQKTEVQVKFLNSSIPVYTDPVLIENILRNLIANAIKYTENGRVLVGCRRKNGVAQICVIDNGPGIPDNLQESIFDVFVKGKNAKPNDGFGLGLAIVKRTAELLGHEVSLKSTLGKGSIFSVSVPVAKEDISTVNVLSSLPWPSTQLWGKSVLIIDDDHAILNGLGTILQQAGCRVHTIQELACAENTTEPCHQCVPAHFQPDLLLIDYYLGDSKTGLDVMHCLRNIQCHDAPCIFLTGDMRQDVSQNIQNAGATVLHKPIQAEALLTAAASMMPN